jgi:hypothetical protein
LFIVISDSNDVLMVDVEGTMQCLNVVVSNVGKNSRWTLGRGTMQYSPAKTVLIWIADRNRRLLRLVDTVGWQRLWLMVDRHQRIFCRYEMQMNESIEWSSENEVEGK